VQLYTETVIHSEGGGRGGLDGDFVFEHQAEHVVNKVRELLELTEGKRHRAVGGMWPFRIRIQRSRNTSAIILIGSKKNDKQFLYSDPVLSRNDGDVYDAGICRPVFYEILNFSTGDQTFHSSIATGDGGSVSHGLRTQFPQVMANPRRLQPGSLEESTMDDRIG